MLGGSWRISDTREVVTARETGHGRTKAREITMSNNKPHGTEREKGQDAGAPQTVAGGQDPRTGRSLNGQPAAQGAAGDPGEGRPERLLDDHGRTMGRIADRRQKTGAVGSDVPRSETVAPR